MPDDLDLIEELKNQEAKELVRSTCHVDDLTYLVVSHPIARNKAAEKLLEIWEKGPQRYGVTLDHLSYVGDHADEPYKSQANKIIRDNL